MRIENLAPRNLRNWRRTLIGMNTTTKSFRRVAVVLLTASLLSLGFTQTPSTKPVPRADSTDEKSGTLSRADRKFLETASKSGTKEVIISQDVLPKLVDPKIREFAQMMVSDHGAANSQLAELVSRNGVTVPAISERIDRKWSEKTKDVDGDYIKVMVDDHEEAVELFQKAAKSDNAEIAAFAQKMLPSLQQHLAQAKELKNSLK